jgi:hypothetical protein
MKKYLLKSAVAFIALVLFACGDLKAQSWIPSGSDAICTNGGATRIVVKSNGTVWIGDGSGTQKASSTILFVDGHMKAREVIVNMANWPDYVFDSAYVLIPLDSLQVVIDSTGHLPNVPSAKAIAENGLNVAEMNAILMRKLEEMQLYILQLNARIKELEIKDTN